MNKELKHFGILGMKWGHRKAISESSGGGRAGTAIGGDGRKKDKIFGKRNRTKIRNFFLGNPKEFVKQMPILRTKFKEMSKEDKQKTLDITSKALAAVSIVSMASLAYMFKNA